MTREERVNNINNELHSRGIKDINFAGISHGSCDDYEDAIKALDESSGKFPTNEELKQRIKKA